MAEIVQAQVVRIAFVGKPANRKPMIVKSEDKDGKTELLFTPSIKKYDKLRRLAYVTFYEPLKKDTDNDWMKPETVETIAHDFLWFCRMREIDINHDGRLDKGCVVESYILRGTNPMYPNTEEGSWVGVIKFGDEVEIRIEELTGVSIEGPAKLDFQSEPPASKSAKGKTLIKVISKPKITVS